MDPCTWTAALVLGLGSLLLGVKARYDRNYRSLFDKYFDRQWPFLVRNRAFGLIPGGVGFLIGCIAIVTDRLGGRWTLVASVLALLTLLAWIVGIVAVSRPPEWLKPEWLREEERWREGGN